MSVYVYCSSPSNGAFELVKALEATRLRKFDGMDFWRRGRKIKLAQGDVIICWGKPIPELEGIRVLNSGTSLNKLEELKELAKAGVKVPQYYVPSSLRFSKGQSQTHNLLGRVYGHQGGADLLKPPTNPNFYTDKLDFSAEYRVHSFCGRSIRAGEKIVREGFQLATEAEFLANLKAGSPKALAHPWIRSFDAGWRIKYDGFVSNKKLRSCAAKAVAALNLKFGAVDIGLAKDAEVYYVLEVNRAPGIEGNTIPIYVRALTKWLKGAEAPAEVEKEVAKVPVIDPKVLMPADLLRPIVVNVPPPRQVRVVQNEIRRVVDNFQPVRNLEAEQMQRNEDMWEKYRKLMKIPLNIEQPRFRAEGDE